MCFSYANVTETTTTTMMMMIRNYMLKTNQNFFLMASTTQPAQYLTWDEDPHAVCRRKKGKEASERMQSRRGKALYE